MLVSLFDELDPPVRQRKLSNHEALRQLLFVMRTGVQWRYIPVHVCNFSTVYKRFQSWTRHGVIDEAWKRMLALYAANKLQEDPRWFREMFIDTTMIKNVGGIDGLGRNPTDRGRMATKLSVIVDNARIPLSCEFFPANRNDSVTAVATVDGICCGCHSLEWTDGFRTS